MHAQLRGVFFFGTEREKKKNKSSLQNRRKVWCASGVSKEGWRERKKSNWEEEEALPRARCAEVFIRVLWFKSLASAYFHEAIESQQLILYVLFLRLYVKIVARVYSLEILSVYTHPAAGRWWIWWKSASLICFELNIEFSSLNFSFVYILRVCVWQNNNQRHCARIYNIVYNI